MSSDSDYACMLMAMCKRLRGRYGISDLPMESMELGRGAAAAAAVCMVCTMYYCVSADCRMHEFPVVLIHEVLYLCLMARRHQEITVDR